MAAATLRQGKQKGLNRSVSSLCVPGLPERNKNLIMRFLMKTGLQDKAFLSAFYVALPNALITLCCSLLAAKGYLPWIKADDPEDDRLLSIQTAVWTAIVSGLSFLAVFRASQAYTRFWQAITSVHLLQIEWLDACGSLFAFCSTSQAPRTSVQRFKHSIVRLFSMYHVAALLRLVEPGVDDAAIAEIAVLDPTCMDTDTQKAFSGSPHRLELVGQWIQVAIMHAIDDKVVTAPPPIVSRCFQEIANGNVRFQDALKVRSIPFPPSYQLVCDLLLLMHFIATPVFTSLWVNSPTAAALLAFASVFVLWSLIFVARSIENPFCTQHFIREAVFMQDDLNARLLTLISPIAAEKPTMPEMTEAQVESSIIQDVTLNKFWADLEDERSLGPSNSILATMVTEQSRVNFSAASATMQAFMNSCDPGEARMSVRQRTRFFDSIDSEGDRRSSSYDTKQLSQGDARGDAAGVEAEVPAKAFHDGHADGDDRGIETNHVTSAGTTGGITGDVIVRKVSSACSDRETVKAQGNKSEARASAEGIQPAVRSFAM